jgi:hypothetical protein
VSRTRHEDARTQHGQTDSDGMQHGQTDSDAETPVEEFINRGNAQHGPSAPPHISVPTPPKTASPSKHARHRPQALVLPINSNMFTGGTTSPFASARTSRPLSARPYSASEREREGHSPRRVLSARGSHAGSVVSSASSSTSPYRRESMGIWEVCTRRLSVVCECLCRDACWTSWVCMDALAFDMFHAAVEQAPGRQLGHPNMRSLEWERSMYVCMRLRSLRLCRIAQSVIPQTCMHAYV